MPDGHNSPKRNARSKTPPIDLIILHGMHLLEREQWSKAIKCFSKVLALDPRNIESHTRRGIASQKVGRIKDAMTDLSESIRLRPNQNVAYLHRSRLRKTVSDFEGAISDLTTYMNHHRKNAILYTERGKLRSHTNDLEGAIRDYDTAIQKYRGEEFRYYLDRAILKASSHNHKAAIADYDRALELNREIKQLLKYRGSSKYQLRDYEGTILDMSALLFLDPRMVQAYQLRASARIELWDFSGALSDYNEAIKLKSSDPGLYQDRAYTRLRLTDLQGALSDCHRAIALNANDGSPFLIRALIKKELNDISGAESDFAHSLLAIPSRAAEIYFHRGMMRIQLNRIKEGLEDLVESRDRGFADASLALQTYREDSSESKGQVSDKAMGPRHSERRDRTRASLKVSTNRYVLAYIDAVRKLQMSNPSLRDLEDVTEISASTWHRKLIDPLFVLALKEASSKMQGRRYSRSTKSIAFWKLIEEALHEKFLSTRFAGDIMNHRKAIPFKDELKVTVENESQGIFDDLEDSMREDENRGFSSKKKGGADSAFD